MSLIYSMSMSVGGYVEHEHGSSTGRSDVYSYIL
jgi:hypothetical protein